MVICSICGEVTALVIRPLIKTRISEKTGVREKQIRFRFEKRNRVQLQYDSKLGMKSKKILYRGPATKAKISVFMILHLLFLGLSDEF